MFRRKSSKRANCLSSPSKMFCATALNQCEALLIIAHLRPIGACAVAFFHTCIGNPATLLLQARLRRFSPYPFGSEGKGLERETLCPFPRLRRFGTHYETGSKFLLLFSIKSKEERPCFAERVPNGRILIFTKRYFGAPAPNKKGAERLLFCKSS